MKALILSSALVAATLCPAAAAVKTLKGPAAERFIQQYLPGSSIPGSVNGTIRCDVPAMGARSDGAVSICVIRYH